MRSVLGLICVVACSSPVLVVSGDDGLPVTSLQFPTTSIGGSSPIELSLHNSGSSSTGELTTTVSGRGMNASGCNEPIGPGLGCPWAVWFSPTTIGTSTGEVVIADSSGTLFTLALSGQGVESAVTLTPSSIDFGGVSVGTTVMRTIEIANNGIVDATLGLRQSNPAIVSDTCTATLAAGARCEVTIAFSPTDVASIVAGNFMVVADGLELDAPLTGAGAGEITIATVGSGSVMSSPGGIACGSTCTGAFTGPVVVTALAAPSSVFAGWSEPACPFAFCTIQPTKTPLTLTATFVVATDGVIFTPSSADFGGWSIAKLPGPPVIFHLTNPTSAAISLGASTASLPFHIYSVCGTTIAANGSCDFQLEFQPTVVGPVTGIVDVIAAGLHRTATLSGTGTP